MVHRLLFCSVLPALGVVNLWWFSHFLELNYLEWSLQEGPLIRLSLGFLWLFWEELETRKGLLSMNQATDLDSRLQLVGVVFQSMGVHLRKLKYGDKNGVSGNQLAIRAWDSLVIILLVLSILVFLTDWTLVVAPLN